MLLMERSVATLKNTFMVNLCSFFSHQYLIFIHFDFYWECHSMFQLLLPCFSSVLYLTLDSFLKIAFV